MEAACAYLGTRNRRIVLHKMTEGLSLCGSLKQTRIAADLEGTSELPGAGHKARHHFNVEASFHSCLQKRLFCSKNTWQQRIERNHIDLHSFTCLSYHLIGFGQP